MSNQAKKDQTQELIKETAKNLFFVKGKFDATTQEIADEAGVNRTLINYYFRSRDKLIQIIFDEAQRVEQEKSKIIQNSDLPFKEKISQFIESSLSTSLQYPYLETYIVSQINKGTCHQREIEEDILNDMYKDIEKEMELGNIEKMAPVQFILNMVALLVFPSAIRPLFMENLLINDEEYDKIISERKEIIINMLFKN
ncbi:TetR/AcrR family transcriptional regulator (plasmid) [Chryseobacterium panacisoli]|jgi:AcrR family transcriptional regulator|uniref:TetR/AcrR family transcriptional regulator n=3 Tax=Chryseobacterium TaxID=59732 RepID=A0A2S9CYN5_CHRCI|nr:MULTISPECIES: TetR/AcrR family transcriptional regulator [Chryseobacterium]MBP1163623.1 AcrR family transcriptional regulator [Chryseobacterium sp. PvR013]MCP1300750.1 TetR/AcrR family transcriptional regulator [Chryseobacterium sp. S0630]MDR4894216.1 TetR/AcrR family transcriptional regulator [Chryseobacterium sp. CFS7]MDR4950821.1 TetR/AcrR family transcriptional regulator [Chryseobacterium sp. ES2]PRB85619.1 TetR/AcrR family transcriptional regulator [Chryseobacterium culicis]